MKTIEETRQLMRERGIGDANKMAEIIKAPSDVPGLKFEWKVTYDRLGHDIIIFAGLNAVDSSIDLLQVFLQDAHPGIWIPEHRPWVLSGVEFKPTHKVKAAMVQLVDSKWRKEDIGATYKAYFWGYVQLAGAVVQFGPYEKEFTYPG